MAFAYLCFFSAASSICGVWNAASCKAVLINILWVLQLVLVDIRLKTIVFSYVNVRKVIEIGLML